MRQRLAELLGWNITWTFDRGGEYGGVVPAPPVSKRARAERLQLLLVSVIMAMTVSCGTGAADTPSLVAREEDTVACNPKTPALRIVVLPDKSKSALRMRTPELRWADLEPVFDRLLRTGGELAVGILDDSSNASLARVRIDEPPIAPEPPKEVGNAWYDALDRKKYRRDSLAYAGERRERLENSERQFVRFRMEVDSLLAPPAYANFTDVWGAINRAAYFLDEPGRWHCEPRKVAVLISDAIDNVGAPSVPWPPTAELYLVNGTPSLGALEQLNPVRFESIEAAVGYVVDASPMEDR